MVRKREALSRTMRPRNQYAHFSRRAPVRAPQDEVPSKMRDVRSAHAQYPPRGIAAARTTVDGGDGTNDGSE
jgi:hypothetical protein